MPVFTVDLLERTMRERGLSLEGSRVAVLGLAYKGDIDDMRESPAHEIIKEIEGRGATTVAYDPYITAHSHVVSLDEALDGAAAAIIVTAHRQFRELAPVHFLEKGVTIVIDGKNCLPKECFLEAGVTYRGIGR
jgi:UDP-N-acetyl-D-mannosaminuronic acid dehydrogenase